MRVMITDDEAPARARLRSLVEELGGMEVVAEAANGQQALMQCHQSAPDVVLLDIRMPGMDGLEAARHMAGLEYPPAVVFTTAYSEHALAAFDAQAVDYLLKPVRKARLRQALDKAQRFSGEQLTALHAASLGQPAQRSHISARLGGKLYLVRIEDVIYFHADDKYVTLRARDGAQVLIEESLKSLAAEFPRRFLRIHRNALAARAFIRAMEKHDKGQYYVELEGCDERLEVSRRHVSEVKALLRSASRAS